MKTPHFMFIATALLAAPPEPAEVRRLIELRCVACHNAKVAQASLRMDNWAAMAAGGITGPVVVPGDAEKSTLYERLVTPKRDHRMPPVTAGLAAEEIAVFKQWIDSGAKGLPVVAAVTKVDFARDVEPIFRAQCTACHGGSRPKAEFRLDSKSAAFRGGVSGAVIVPGNSASSRLLHRVRGNSSEQRMPLNGRPLSATQVAVLGRWIDSGAVWPESRAGSSDGKIEKHWAYRRVERPAPPLVKGESLVRNPIDRFVLAKLESQGLTFSPEAPREKLIRRLSLDITGLPPTSAEVAAFRVGDYAKAVARLLESPHYGERQARPWLDLARYADTNGFEADRRRTMWKYREWVIGAFNRGMGYDQFTVEQLAGDLLPDATTDQKVATGFHRNTMYNEEGGVDRVEQQFEVMVDRVNTTGTVWLGTTLTCTQCHNHKYDPLTQRDYYGMMAFFSTATEPTLDLATPEQESQRKDLTARRKELEKTLATQTPELDSEQAEWLKGLQGAVNDWTVLEPVKLESAAGSTLRAEAGVLTATGENPQRETYVVEARVKLDRLAALRIEALPDPSLPRGGPGRDIYGNFIVTDVKLSVDGKPVELGKATADDGRVNDTARRQLWVVDASREDARLPRQLVLAVKNPPVLGGEATVRIAISQNSDFVGQSLGKFRLSLTGAADPVRIVGIKHKLRASPEAKPLAEFYRSIAKSLDPARAELKAVNDKLAALGIVTALVMEAPKDVEPHDFVRTRGGFAAKTERVSPSVPAVMGGLPTDSPRNRLGLARWLVSRDNPLTARVAVNRIWEQYFGRGLVETSEDFGSQGQRPSHPELLDWLAAEFMESGWNMRHMHELVVASATYRQTSAVSPPLLEADPQNRLLSRGPRFRMEAEMVRDTTLAASGLLSRKIGGPSAMPFQPAGIWDVPYSNDKWEESTGEDRYRRGLYTFVRRSAAYPSMMNFDATSREFCTVRRTRTNTPLQALTTLNDPAFFEAARALASRMEREGGPGLRDQVTFGFVACASRTPRPAEADRLLSGFERDRNYFAAHPDEAAKLGGVEQAARTMLANVLLNMDETLTKE